MTGVSQTTVSLVLNGKTDEFGIADDTVRKVRAAAEELGYVADPIALRMSQGSNRLIGVHTFAATFPIDPRDFSYPFLQGIEEGAAALGYDMILFTGSASGVAAERLGRELSRLRLADGCILLGRHVPVQSLAGLLQDGYPVVYIGRRDELPDKLCFIGADYVTASRDVMIRLYTAGHKHIVYVREDDDAIASTDRERGVREGRAILGLKDEPGWLVRTNGEDLTASWVQERIENGVTAFVVETTDTRIAARRLEHAILEAGLNFPRDVSFVTLGEYALSSSGGLQQASGFEIPRVEMGRRAVDLLVRMLEGQEINRDERQQLLPCIPFSGDSVATR